jgi:hypothetical protein
MNNFDFEDFNTLRTESFVKFCDELFDCFTDTTEKYFTQEKLDDFLLKHNLYIYGKYATLYKGERMFDRGYNKNIIDLLNVFFYFYGKRLDVFILNEGSLIEIIPSKKPKSEKIFKKISKIKVDKIKTIIDKEITIPKLQRK